MSESLGKWIGRRRALAMLAGVGVLLAGCGFRLSGDARMPFDSLYVAAPDYFSFGAEFRRYVESHGRTRITDNPDEAQAVLEILSESEEKQILSLTSAGRVAEYLLRYRVSFQLRDRTNRVWIPASEISLQRDLTYDPTIALAKEHEERFLYQDMKRDAIQQVLRRLAAVDARA